MITRNLKYFFSAFLLSIPLWWSLDLIAQDAQDFFLAQELDRSEFLTAAATQARLDRELAKAYPLPKKNRTPLRIDANGAYAMLVKEDGTTKALVDVRGDEPFFIASLTKLMTALVATTNYPPRHRITVTPEIVAIEGESGQLRQGDTFTVEDFIRLALIESSNDAAVALASPLGQDRFVQQMNEKAIELRLQTTWFVDPTGLDPDTPENPGNFASAKDMSVLARYIFERHPQIFESGSQAQPILYNLDGGFHHTMQNTNPLLDYTEWPAAIIGGKTGLTPLAQETFVLLAESPDGQGIVVSVILGTDDRFSEMKNLLQWILDSYQWSL